MLSKESKLKKELKNIKIVLCALWDNNYHPEAQEIIKKFKEVI